LEKLQASGEVERVGEGLFPVLTNLSLYDDDLGLMTDRSGELSPEQSIL
jgi:hypothetical protein